MDKKENKELKPLIVEDEIDLIALWQRIRLGWKEIIGSAILGILILGGIGYLLPPKYEVTGIVKIPESWDVSSEITSRIIRRYVELEKYSEVGKVEHKVLDKKNDVTYEILLSQNTEDVITAKENLNYLLESLDEDENIKEISTRATEDLESQLQVVEKNLEDAYDKKNQFNKIIGTKESVYITFNPIEMDTLISNLESERIVLSRKITESKELNWDMSPSTDYIDQQVSAKMLALVGLIIGLGVGGIIALVRYWK